MATLEPVTIGDDRVYGTLCGASTARVPEAADARRLMRVFAKLIGRHIEREQLLETLRREHDSYRAFALTDPLTLIPNRRAMVSELNRALANAERRGEVLHAGVVVVAERAEARRHPLDGAQVDVAVAAGVVRPREHDAAAVVRVRERDPAHPGVSSQHEGAAETTNDPGRKSAAYGYSSPRGA